MRIVFMGTPDFAVPSLAKLMDAGQQLIGVVTVPDKPAKRGCKLQPSRVKVFAQSKGLPVLQPQQLNDPEFVQQLTEWSADLFMVVAFRILPVEVLKIPRLGAVNLHASLLPKYRGAAPINWALIHGETETGVTTFFIDKNIDTGEILLQQKVSITPEMTAGELHDILAEMGSDLVVRTAVGIEAGSLVAVSQSGEPTRAPKLTKEMEKIDWSLGVQNLHNLIRGMSPSPGCYAILHGKSIKLLRSACLPHEQTKEMPGSVVFVGKNGPLKVQTGDGIISLLELQPEGRKKMTAAEFIRGARIIIGDRFS